MLNTLKLSSLMMLLTSPTWNLPSWVAISLIVLLLLSAVLNVWAAWLACRLP